MLRTADLNTVCEVKGQIPNECDELEVCCVLRCISVPLYVSAEYQYCHHAMYVTVHVLLMR